MTAIVLPWPPKELSPNSRKARRHCTDKRRAYRDAGFYAARDAGVLPTDAKRLHLAITFHAPDNRRRDLDNMLASIKSGLDGISTALGVDDSRWSLSIQRGEVRKGGEVVINVREAA